MLVTGRSLHVEGWTVGWLPAARYTWRGGPWAGYPPLAAREGVSRVLVTGRSLRVKG